MPPLKLPTDLSAQANGATQVAEAIASPAVPDLFSKVNGASEGSDFAKACSDLAQSLSGDLKALASSVNAFGNQLTSAASTHVSMDQSFVPGPGT